jgi:hypothetical protein
MMKKTPRDIGELLIMLIILATVVLVVALWYNS